MATTVINKVSALPGVLVANAMYAVADGPDRFKFYMADNTGTTARRVDQTQEVLDQVVAVSETAPDLAVSKARFWLDSSRGILFVRYENAGNPIWMEAQSSAQLPEFAGTGGLFGTADTVARGDHQHDHLVIEADW